MDIDSRLQAIEEKIHLQDKKLIHQESKLRLRKRLGLISIALLVAFAVFAATRPVAHVIEARKFIFKNQQGHPVGIWGSDLDGLVYVDRQRAGQPRPSLRGRWARDSAHRLQRQNPPHPRDYQGR